MHSAEHRAQEAVERGLLGGAYQKNLSRFCHDKAVHISVTYDCCKPLWRALLEEWLRKAKLLGDKNPFCATDQKLALMRELARLL